VEFSLTVFYSFTQTEKQKRSWAGIFGNHFQSGFWKLQRPVTVFWGFRLSAADRREACRLITINSSLKYPCGIQVKFSLTVFYSFAVTEKQKRRWAGKRFPGNFGKRFSVCKSGNSVTVFWGFRLSAADRREAVTLVTIISS
jgi:hypothetical protein